jgi:TonB family protein
MNVCRIASAFTFVLLAVCAAIGHQSSIAPEGRASLQSSSSESQSASCRPQKPTAMTPFDTCKYLLLGPGIRCQRPLSAPDPEYSEAARKAKLEGTVVLAVAINENGGVDDVKVVRHLEPSLEQKAIDAIKQWKFAPATKDSKPVAVQMNVDVTFKLY